MEKYTPTPEEKAKLHQRQLLTDAEHIRKGAKFEPGADGEPVLKLSKEEQMNMQWRDAPESLPETYTLLKIIEKLTPPHHYPSSPSSLDRKIINVVSEDVTIPGSKDEKLEVTLSLHTGDNFGTDRPYIEIDRSTYYYTRDGAGARSPERARCYSLQEFYDNLKPEEREKGEAWGKELESYIEE